MSSNTVAAIPSSAVGRALIDWLKKHAFFLRHNIDWMDVFCSSIFFFHCGVKGVGLVSGVWGHKKRRKRTPFNPFTGEVSITNGLVWFSALLRNLGSTLKRITHPTTVSRPGVRGAYLAPKFPKSQSSQASVGRADQRMSRHHRTPPDFLCLSLCIRGERKQTHNISDGAFSGDHGGHHSGC